jgi:hypothetical protein
LNVHFWPEASFPLAKLVSETIAKSCHQNACPWLPCVTRRIGKKCQFVFSKIAPKCQNIYNKAKNICNKPLLKPQNTYNKPYIETAY